MMITCHVSALKYAVDHPLTNYDEVPGKGFLPPWHCVQHTAAYYRRKVKKSVIPPSIPMVFATTNNSFLRLKNDENNKNTFGSSKPSTSSQLQAIGKSSIVGIGRQGQRVHDNHRENTLHQIDEVLESLNADTSDFATRPVGHGMNLKENIESLKAFARPATALKGLASMVKDVISEIDK